MVLTNLAVSDIVGLILRFEAVYKEIPKINDERNQLEPLQVSRKVEASGVIRSEIMDLVKTNFHFDASFRTKDVIAETLNRASLFTKPVATRIALYDSSSISLYFPKTVVCDIPPGRLDMRMWMFLQRLNAGVIRYELSYTTLEVNDLQCAYTLR